MIDATNGTHNINSDTLMMVNTDNNNKNRSAKKKTTTLESVRMLIKFNRKKANYYLNYILKINQCEVLACDVTYKLT